MYTNTISDIQELTGTHTGPNTGNVGPYTRRVYTNTTPGHTGCTRPHTGDTPDLTIKKPKPYVTNGWQSAGVPFTLRCVLVSGVVFVYTASDLTIQNPYPKSQMEENPPAGLPLSSVSGVIRCIWRGYTICINQTQTAALMARVEI